MKKILFLILNIISINSYSQSTVTITGPSSVEVGIPNNFSFKFEPQYITNNNGVTPDNFVITEWVVTTATNGSNTIVPGYIATPSNQGNYYNNSTYNGPGMFTIPIQWGDGGNFTVNNDLVTVKVSGWYKKNSTNENLGYFNYVTAEQNVSIQRMNKPIINGSSPITSYNQDNKTYTIANSTNASNFLWSVNNGGTIVGAGNGTSVVIKPPLCGTFTVACEVKRSSSNSNYVLQGSKVVTRDPFLTTAEITGNANICPSSSGSYTVSNLGTNTVNWSLSDASLASLSATSGTNVTVNAITEGAVVLTATIINACNQTATKTFAINIGAAKLNNNKIQGGYDNVPVGSQSVLTVEAAIGATSYQWSIVPINSSCISSSGSTTGTLPYLVNNGYYSRVARWGTCTGLYRVRCYASNSCGVKYYSDKVVRVFNSSNNPCPSGAKIVHQSVKGDDGSVNIIDEPDLPPCNNSEVELKQAENVKQNTSLENLNFTVYPNPSNGNFTIDLGIENVKYTVAIFSSIGRKVFEKINSEDSSISLSNLKPGIYMVMINVNETTMVKNIVIK